MNTTRARLSGNAQPKTLQNDPHEHRSPGAAKTAVHSGPESRPQKTDAMRRFSRVLAAGRSKTNTPDPLWAKRTGGAMYQGTVGKAFPARRRAGIPSAEPTGRGNVDDFGRRSLCKPSKLSLRKEVIQPQVPLRLPCYDLVPVTSLAVGTPELRRLRALPASMT